MEIIFRERMTFGNAIALNYPKLVDLRSIYCFHFVTHCPRFVKGKYILRQSKYEIHYE